MPIRVRVALLVSAIATALVVGGGLWFSASLAHDLRATLERTLRARVLRVDAQLVAGLLPLGAGGQPVHAAPDQSMVQVLSAAGTLRYTTDVAGRVPLIGAAAVGAAGHHPTWSQRRRPAWRNPHLLLAEPGPRGSGEVVVVGTSLDQLQDSTGRVRLALLVGGPLVVLLSGGGAWALAGVVLEPVERLRSQAAALSTAGPEHHLAVPRTRDELAALATTLNDLLGRLQASLREQRHFIAAASHELRTPLAALQAQLDLATRPGRTREEHADTLRSSARRVAQLVALSNRLLVLAEADEGVLSLQRRDQPIGPVVADSLEAQRAHAEDRAVTLVLDADPDVHATVDETRLREVVANLVDNAIRHAPAGSLVEIALRHGRASAIIEVRDHGPGFPPEFLPRAFEPFSRPDPSRTRHAGGSGLGLSVVRTIVEAHGGTVDLVNHQDGGAMARVRLPSGGSPTGVPTAGSACTSPPQPGPRTGRPTAGPAAPEVPTQPQEA